MDNKSLNDVLLHLLKKDGNTPLAVLSHELTGHDHLISELHRLSEIGLVKEHVGPTGQRHFRLADPGYSLFEEMTLDYESRPIEYFRLKQKKEAATQANDPKRNRRNNFLAAIFGGLIGNIDHIANWIGKLFK